MRTLVAALLIVALPLAAVGDERTQALAAHIEALEHNGVLNDAARIQQMYDALIAIADLPPDRSVEPLLERHAKAGYRLPGFRTDDGHRTAITTHDTAAAARFAQQQWARQRGRIMAQVALAARTGAFDFRASEATLAGYAQAFAKASDTELAVTRSGIAAALSEGAAVEPLTLILVERLKDMELANLLLAQGRPELLIHMLQRIAKAFPADDAVPLLAAATTRPELASAAVARIGRLSVKSHVAHDWLLEHFADEKLGPSAAAALAATGDPIAIAAMADTLHGSKDVLTRSRAALGLKLADTRAARDALKRFADDPDAPASLRAQVREWLR